MNDKKLLLELSWNYECPQEMFYYFIDKKDWIQTLNVKFNEVYSNTRYPEKNYFSDIISAHPYIIKHIISQLEYYDPKTRTIGKFNVVGDDSLIANSIIMYCSSNKDAYSIIRLLNLPDFRKMIGDKKKVALLFGITGQDGSYLTELLLEKGYEVHGVIRRSSSFNTGRIDHLMDKIQLHYGDVTDPLSVSSIISQIKPDEIYNLSAQSHVKVSFEMPFYTGQVDALGTMSILESARLHCPEAKIYHASTSELFGGMEYNRPEAGYDESSAFHPRSPYGVAKIYGYWAAKNYREAYNMFICNGILFNHESERRGGTFVTKKVVDALVDYKLNNGSILKIGNLEAKRDWGYAKEFVEGMWMMLQQDKPDDYVLATGKVHTVRELIEITAELLGYKIEWRGIGVDEKGYDVTSGELLVEVDPKYFRPSEVDLLLGNPSKAKRELGWKPKTKFKDLITIMVEDKIAQLNKQ